MYVIDDEMGNVPYGNSYSGSAVREGSMMDQLSRITDHQQQQQKQHHHHHHHQQEECDDVDVINVED